MSKGKIITLIILLSSVLLTIVMIIGIYQLGWLDFIFKNNNLSEYSDVSSSTTIIDTSDDSALPLLLSDNTNDITSDITTTLSTKIKSNDKQKHTFLFNKDNKKSNPIDNIKKTNPKKFYAKGSNLPDQDFDSYGEYVSQEEYRYRTELIRNLKIKTVVIDSLSKNNGISQEFYKVVYINKMIPSKILDRIVESKEFRNLIPKKFLNKENTINLLQKGEKVIFPNTKIRELLILWSQGKLSPIQKAWKVSALK